MVLYIRVGGEANVKLFGELDSLADIVGYESFSSSWVYRLNPAKVSHHSLEKVVGFLTKELGLHIPAKTLYFLRKVCTEPFHMYIELDNGILIIHPQKANMVAPLISDGVVSYSIHLKAYVAKAKDLHTVLKYAEEQGLKVKLSFDLNYKASFTTSFTANLDSCLENAYKLWKESGYRGVVIHPVPERRRLVALKAVHELGVKTVILVPTVEHVKNWYKDLVKTLKIPEELVGVYGAGVKRLGEVTIMTYDIAARLIPKLSSFFGFVIADECEIAVRKMYRSVLTSLTAPYRLGLTSHQYAYSNPQALYPRLIGPVLFNASLNELFEKGCVPRFRVLRVYVRLSDEEYEEWRRLMKRYEEFCKSALPNVKESRKRLRMLLELTSRDDKAREALRARLKAREVVLAFEKKIRAVARLLELFSDEQIVVFSRYEDFVREFSRKLIVPAILPEIPDDERRAYMKMFNRGIIRILATSTLLEEYIEAPQPPVAIVVSGVVPDEKYTKRVTQMIVPRKREALLIEVLTARPCKVKCSFSKLEKALSGVTM